MAKKKAAPTPALKAVPEAAKTIPGLVLAQPLLRLERVRVRDFRAVADAVLELGDVTVLMGENNVGKTALLEALDIAIGDGFAATTDLRMDGADVAAPRFIIDLELRPWEGTNLAQDVIDALGPVYHLEAGTQVQRYFLRVISEPDQTHREMKMRRLFVTAWDASLDLPGEELTTTQRRDLWFSLLDARRDLVDDLRRRSSPWGKMLRKLELDATARAQFEQRLSALSTDVVEALPDAEKLAMTIGRLHSALAGQVTKAELSLVPKTLDELWRTADLVVQGTGQPKLSISQQGMGARSLSSLLAFRAWLEAELSAGAQAAASPLLVVTAFEEPEAHLHPQAQRAAFGEISGLPGQRIVSTHSPHIVAAANVEDFRVVRRATSVSIRSTRAIANKPGVDAQPLENVRRFCIRRNADMLFARAVLLCEGDTDHAIISALATIWWASPPEHKGVAVVGLDGAGNAFTFGSFLAQLDIPWVLLLDGDDEGVKTQAAIAADADLATRAGTDVILLEHGGLRCDMETMLARTAKVAVIKTLAQNPQHELALGKESETQIVKRLKDIKGSHSSSLARALVADWDAPAKMPESLQKLFARADTLKG